MSFSDVAFTPKLNRAFYDIERSIVEVSVHPLKAHRELDLLFETVLQEPVVAGASTYLEEVKSLLDRMLEQGLFLDLRQCQLLMAWVTELRSQWIRRVEFKEPNDFTLLQRLHADLLRSEKSQEQPVQSFHGFFEGDIDEGFHNVAKLSDFGYWVIDRADNHICDHNHQAMLYLRVILETGLSLQDLQINLPNWKWSLIKPGDNTALKLPANSENYWVDWLHLMATEREVWRRSASFLRFYQSLQEQVRQQFSQPLDAFIRCSGKTNLRVLMNSDVPEEIEDFDLYGGRVFLQDAQGFTNHVLPLSESVIPVYIISYANDTMVIPVFSVLKLEENLADEDSGWVYRDNSWDMVRSGKGFAGSITIKQSKQTIRVFYEAINREYGAVLRSNCLPQEVRNVWSVREDFLLEPALPLEKRQKGILLKHSYSPSAYQIKPRKPVFFQIMPNNGIELFADMVVGLVPYSSVRRLMKSFVYHSGQVIPLIEPEASYCHSDDMVIFIASKGVYFAFRGRYSIGGSAVHKLIEGEQIVLSKSSEGFQITLLEEGWFFLDQRHTYLLQKQMLEIMD
ncbi:hypothetical protein [Marinomonas ostreistagni]|uniref:Uncharacterized protein n=1 Tax=Marinomonas ostreistagni TaxID=359209 RepID=A0ABS0Z6F6_9GAMM|nr:hypothetical protein [Marinomonas ostreistagni]MBJ7549242.1 hypothetical protein [Marinomonas ostreistagni]